MIPDMPRLAFYIILFVIILAAAVSIIFLFAAAGGAHIGNINSVLSWILGQR